MTTQRRTLQQNADEYKSALTDQLTNIKDTANKYGKTALIVVGTLFVTYKLIKLLSSSDKEEIEIKTTHANSYPVPVYTRSERTIFDMIKEQIALFLIALAKERLIKFIEENDLFKTSESKD